MATIFLHFPDSARMGINIYRSEKNYFLSIWIMSKIKINLTNCISKEEKNFLILQSYNLQVCTIKVIKEKWGQYFANHHFCTPLCSKRNGNLGIKKFLEQKFANSSLINLAPNTWFNEKNAIKKVCTKLVFWYIVHTMLYGYAVTRAVILIT